MPFILILSAIIFSSQLCAQNMLYKATSPYLLQHQENPVHWLEYNQKSLDKATKENKMIFLSIGYSTCHWCHVMAKESFENPQIAALINRDYIPIKVDREELSHIDTKYQRLHKLVRKRSGGWPLTALLLPDEKPFFIATYIPERQKYGMQGLDTLLPSYAKKFKQSPNILKNRAQKITLLESNHLYTKTDTTILNLSIVPKILDAYKAQYDTLYHGFSKAPKFPESAKIALLFTLNALHQKESKKMALDVLDTMAQSGIYDHIEGGFFRYSTDAAWQIPHFEKMLYTNAELLHHYLQAYILTNKVFYKKVIMQTLAMIDTRFSVENLYYSASNADSNTQKHEHEEGAYFIYSVQEPEKTLSLYKEHQRKKLQDAFALDDFPNFENNYHISYQKSVTTPLMQHFIEQLKLLRAEKIYPFIDKKINTAWNAMMIEVLFKLSSHFPHTQTIASHHLDALLSKQYQNGVLYHQSISPYPPTQKALLEDYAFLIPALIAGYEATFDSRYLYLAIQLSDQVSKKFLKEHYWMLSQDQAILADSQDKYYTAPQHKLQLALLHLSAITSDRKLHTLIQESAKKQKVQLTKNPLFSPSAMRVHLALLKGFITIKATKENLLKNRTHFLKADIPFLAFKADKDLKGFLACDLNQCFAIDNNLSSFLKKISSN
jgi:uncharacterized protein